MPPGFKWVVVLREYTRNGKWEDEMEEDYYRRGTWTISE